MAKFYAQEVSMTVLSRGALYFKVNIPGESRAARLPINERTEHLKAGDSFTAICVYDRSNSFTLTPVTEQELEEHRNEYLRIEREQDVQSCQRRFEAGLARNYVDETSLQKLKAFGVDTSAYDANITQIRQAVRQARIEEIQLGVERDLKEGRVSFVDLEQLHEAGFSVSVYEERLQELFRLGYLGELWQLERCQRMGLKISQSVMVSFSYYEGCESVPSQLGEVYQSRGHWLKCVSLTRKSFETGPEIAVYGRSRLATNEEISRAIAERTIKNLEGVNQNDQN